MIDGSVPPILGVSEIVLSLTVRDLDTPLGRNGHPQMLVQLMRNHPLRSDGQSGGWG